MKIRINEKIDEKILENEMKVTIEHRKDLDLEKFIDYINEYDNQKILVKQDYEIIQIDIEDIVLFYSNKKETCCKTKDGEYKVRSTLNELEKIPNFVRISRSAIINLKHINKFDLGITGTIVVKLDEGTEEFVSRRRAKEILKLIRERSI